MTQVAQAGPKQVYMTLNGLPLGIELEWPFHRSVSGADFYVLHADARLHGSDGLHALVALQLTLTVREMLPSLEPKDVEAPSINTIRKAVDTKDIEFQKTPKRVPIQFNSRRWDFKRNKWSFGQASEEQIAAFLERKAYWQSKLYGGKVWVADPTDAQYLDTPAEKVTELARQLVGKGLLQLDGEWASATEQLLAQSGRIEGDSRQAREELEKKHAFERG